MNIFPVSSQLSFPVTIYRIVISESSVENKHFTSYPIFKENEDKATGNRSSNCAASSELIPQTQNGRIQKHGPWMPVSAQKEQ